MAEFPVQFQGLAGRRQPVALIVDDEAMIQVILREFFMEHFPGFQVEEASDGFEAGLKIHRFRPDLILLDILLPGQTGFSVCEEIRKNPDFSRMTIIAISGIQDKSIRNTIFELGVNDFILKPYKIRDLIQKIDQHLPAEVKRQLEFFGKNKAA